MKKGDDMAIETHVKKFGNKVLINPGSVGQSRDEIDAPGFATITFQGKKKRKVTWYRYKYDFDEFLNKMKSKNAPPEIFEREFWHI